MIGLGTAAGAAAGLLLAVVRTLFAPVGVAFGALLQAWSWRWRRGSPAQR